MIGDSSHNEYQGRNHVFKDGGLIPRSRVLHNHTRFIKKPCKNSVQILVRCRLPTLSAWLHPWWVLNFAQNTDLLVEDNWHWTTETCRSVQVAYMSRSSSRYFVLCTIRRRLTWCLSLLALLTCLTDEGCDLHRLISLMFRPVCQLSVVAPSRLLVLRSGTAYQMMSPPLRPCQPSGAIWRHTYSSAVTTLTDTACT